MIKMKFILFIVFYIFLTSISYANNGSLGFDFLLKRYVYNESNKGGISIDLQNNNPQSYLMEVWIAASDEDTLLTQDTKVKKNNEEIPFIILPPLKVLGAGSEMSWNIRRIGNKVNGVDLPNDRESLFWIGIRAIPGVEKDEENNSIHFNVIPNFYFKLLYRPKGIENLKTKDLAKKVKIIKEKNKLVIQNPTPFYLTFNYLKVGEDYVKNQEREITLTPFSTKNIFLEKNSSGSIKWQFTDESLIELEEELLN